MASNTIGTTSLLLSADAAQLNQALSQTQNRISAFVTNINSSFSYVGYGLKGFVAGVAIQLTQKLGTLFGQLKQGVAEIASDAKIADRLGVPFGQFSTLMAATKLDANSLQSAMQGVADASARAAIEQAKTGNTSGRSGKTFQQLGIDPNQLRGLGAEKQFETIGKAISNIASPIEQNRLAIKLFGEAGGQIAQQFRGDFGKAMQSARDLGLVLSDEDAASAKAAQQTFQDTGRIITGLFRQASAAVAPAIGAINLAFQSFWATVSPIVRNVIDGIRAFSLVVVAVKDELVSLFQDSGYAEYWQQWRTDIPQVRDLMLVFIRSISESIAGWVDFAVGAYADVLEYFFAPMAHSWADLQQTIGTWISDFDSGFVQPFLDAIDTMLAGLQALSTATGQTALSSAFATARQGLEAVRDIPGAIATGYAAAANAGFDAADALRAGADSARQFTGSADAVGRFFDSVERRARSVGQNIGNAIADGIDPILQQRAAALHDKFQSPVAALDRSIADLSELFNNGLISEIELAQSVEAAMATAEKGLHIEPAKFATAAAQGSKEAVAAIYHRDFDTQPSAEDRLRQIQERGLALNEIQTRNSETMVRLLQERGDIEFF